MPDLNLFMMCEALNRDAISLLPKGYYARSCRPDELHLWEAFPFDSADLAAEYAPFMQNYFADTYATKSAEFFAQTIFICTPNDEPIATCLLWKAYHHFNTIQWFKVRKDFAGKGIGRALLSLVMQDLGATDYPVYLHTQPDSFRAIKLYNDFGFSLMMGDKVGNRQNDLAISLPILADLMPHQHFSALRFCATPVDFHQFLLTQHTDQF